MATRSVTEAFILMRNNAMQSRHIYSEQGMDDRVALVTRDLELGHLYSTKDSRLPPEWVDGVEEFHYEVSRIEQKMKELSVLHDKHLNRPTLDDSTNEELAIEHISQEATQMFQHCQRLIHQVSARSRGSTSQEQRINQNVLTSLVTSLQRLYLEFRKAQSDYLKRLKMREERSQHYFETGMSDLGGGDDTELLREELHSRGFTQEQLMFLEDNTWFVEQREREISQVVRSIGELNEVFKDLAQIVVDQGTVLDRIDYNIEHSQVKVREGLKELQKAEVYHKKNRKMYCIFILAGVASFLLVILITTKLHF